MKSNAKSLLKIWAVVLALLLSQEHGHAKSPSPSPAPKGKTSAKAAAPATAPAGYVDPDQKAASAEQAKINAINNAQSVLDSCLDDAEKKYSSDPVRLQKTKAGCEQAYKATLSLGGAKIETDEEKEAAECKEDNKKFKDEKAKFNEAAKAINKKSDLTPIEQAIICTNCTGGSGSGLSHCDQEALEKHKREEEELKRKERQNKKTITAATQTATKEINTVSIGLKYSKNALVSCPPYGATVAKELGEKIKKTKEDDRKNDDELGKLIESLQENQAKKENVKNEAQEEVAKLEEKKQEELDKLEESATDETKKLRKEYDEATDAISQIMDKLLPAVYEKHRAQITAIELECEQQAYKKLEEYLTARRGLLNSSKLGTDSFLKLARQTGPTRKEKNAAIAEEHFDACTSGGMFNAKKKQIDNELAFAVKDMESKVASLRQTMYKKMEEISGSERQNAYMKKLKKIESSYSTKIETTKTKAMAEYQALEAKGQKIQEDIKKLQLRIEESKARMSLMASLYSAASTGAGGAEEEPEKFRKFTTSFGLVSAYAADAFSSCKCAEGKDKDGSTCNQIKAVACAVKEGALNGCDGFKTLKETLEERRESK